jgi:fatty-acyl-CoA synthase
MLPGQMMNMPLTINTIMDFAEWVLGDSEIVSVTADNPEHRYTYADSFRRTRQLANALAAAGVEPGDRGYEPCLNGEPYALRGARAVRRGEAEN